jgi:multidrug efflux system membrane fusion protein
VDVGAVRRIVLLVPACCALAGAATVYVGVPSVDRTALRAWISPLAPTPGRPRGPGLPVRVTVANVEVEDVPIGLATIGTVQAYNTVGVKSRVDGEIVKILFQEGQDVEIGEPLAIIDPRPYEAQLRQQEAMRRKDNAQLDVAVIDLHRYENLRKTSAVTQQQLDQQSALVEQLRAQILNDEAQIDYARTQLEYTTIRSPIPGRTGIRLIDQGNIVHGTDTNNIVVLTQLRPISVVFTVAAPLVARNRLTLGQTNIPVIAFAADGTTQLDRGKVDLVDNQVDQTTGTIKLKASFPNAELRLWPGDFVNGRLIVDTRRNGVVVPSAALRHGPRGDYVWLVRADGTVEARRVTSGQIADGRTLIDQGLAVGDRVVTDGHFLLEAGSRIEVVKVEPALSPKTPQVAAEP